MAVVFCAEKVKYMVKRGLVISIIIFSIFLTPFYLIHGTYAHKIRRVQSVFSTHSLKGLPVLMYHSISDEKTNDAFVLSVNKFREQMHYLHRHGFHTLSMKQVMNFLTKNQMLPEKPILITIDDGYQNIYTNAFPIMRRYGIHGTIFVIANTIDRNSDYLTSSELRQMQRFGITVESHTLNHENLSQLSYAQQLYTLSFSKTEIEHLTGERVHAIAYPFGKFNDLTLRAARAAGYTLGFTTNGGYVNRSDNVFKMKRCGVYGPDTMSMFCHKVDAVI